MIYVLQRKSDKLFYTGNRGLDKNIEKARLFKKNGLVLFLNCLKKNKIFVYVKTKGHFLDVDEFNFIGIEFKKVGIQKQLEKEYKTKQLLKELEK